MRKKGFWALGLASAMVFGCSITGLAEGSEGAIIGEDQGFAAGSVNFGEDSSIEDKLTDTYEGLRLVDGKWVYIRNGVQDTTVNSLVYYEEGGEWFCVTNGEVDISSTGFVEYDGGQFYVAEGRVCREASGLVQDPGTKEWRFAAEGQVQIQYTGLAEYDGAWFLLESGVMQESYSGLYPYDGAYFLIADGRILNQYSGLFEYDGIWYFIADGQVSSYTGMAEYDGAWFYIEDGILNSSFTGYIKYNGSWFYMENGVLRSDSTADLLVTLQSTAASHTGEAEAVLANVNKYRAEVGAEALVLDEDLCLAATMRAQEMADTGFFSHTRPDGTTCYTALEQFSIVYRAAGENIAYGYANADAVCDGWYHSPGHYANMISTSFKKLGVGLAVDKNGTPYWVQLFTN